MLLLAAGQWVHFRSSPATSWKQPSIVSSDLSIVLTTDFMESVLKDIRMERSKIRPADSIRALVVSSFCMDYLLIRREKRRAALDKNGKNATTPEKIDEALPLGMCAVMIELDSVRFVASRMKTAMDDKPPAWTELEASIICFTQIVGSDQVER